MVVKEVVDVQGNLDEHASIGASALVIWLPYSIPIVYHHRLLVVVL